MWTVRVYVTCTIVRVHVTCTVALVYVTCTVARVHVNCTCPCDLYCCTWACDLYRCTWACIVAREHVTCTVARVHVTCTVAHVHVTCVAKRHYFGIVIVLLLTKQLDQWNYWCNAIPILYYNLPLKVEFVIYSKSRGYHLECGCEIMCSGRVSNRNSLLFGTYTVYIKLTWEC